MSSLTRLKDEVAPEQETVLRQTYQLAWTSIPVLLVYAAAQVGVSIFVGPKQGQLKLVLEPYLLLLGLILHIQWRRVSRDFFDLGLRRPYWIAAADCLSFVITFWALSVLVHAFLVEAGLI